MNIFSKVDGIPIESFDMSNPSLYQEGVALHYFERLRRDCPVHYCESSNYGAFWSITKYKDILSVDKNHHLFSADSSILCFVKNIVTHKHKALHGLPFTGYLGN